MGTLAESLGMRVVGSLLRADQWLAQSIPGPPPGALDPRTLAWTQSLEAAWPAIRQELDGLLASGYVLPDTNSIAGADQGGTGSWTTYVMHWYGHNVKANLRRCPVTASLINAVPDLQVAGFTVLGPGAHLPLHEGPTRALRYHLGMIVPEPAGTCGLRIGSETTIWEERGEQLFDDRTPHEAWNHGTGPRYVLFVQVRLPVRGWRGLGHRATQRLFGAITGIGRRATALDRELNPARDPSAQV